MRVKLTIAFLISGIYSFSQNPISYDYDNLNRLTRSNIAPCKYVEYKYDAEGNRISEKLIDLKVKDSVIRPCFSQANGKIFISPLSSNSRYNYVWNTGQSGPSLINISGGMYSVSIFDSINNATCQLSYNLAQYPNDSFHIVKQDVTCKGSQNGEIRVIRAPFTPGNFKYEWSNGSRDSILKNLSGSVLTLLLTNLQTGCSKKYTIQVTEPKEDIIVIPNPTKSKAILEFCCEKDADMDVSVFTVGGQLVKHYTKAIHPISNRETIDFSNYQRGIYLVRLFFNNQTKTAKVVKL